MSFLCKLEYNPSKGIFHFNFKLETSDSNNYYQVFNNIPIDTCREFSDFIYEKYPNLDKGSPLSLNIIKEEFKYFLLLPI